MKKTDIEKTLKTWKSLNEVVLTADETTCRMLIEEEIKGRKREQFIMRLFSRYNRVRAARERCELRLRLS
jgi:hypothetical protein